MNLVIALLSTRSFITAERIRETVSGYADSPSDEAFSRMRSAVMNERVDSNAMTRFIRRSTLEIPTRRA